MKILLLACALGIYMYFAPSDGAEIRRNLGKCPKNGYKTIVVYCTNKCKIKRARVFFKKGENVDMFGKIGSTAEKSAGCGKSCFCKGTVRRGRSKTCAKKRNYRINAKSVNFVLKCKKAATNVRIIVNGNVKFPSRPRTTTLNLGHCFKEGQYKTAEFNCDGNCEIKSATARFDRGGNADIVGRVGRRVFTPLLCGKKCFCRGLTKVSNSARCIKKKGYRRTSKSVSFVVRCRKMTRNVRLAVNGNVKIPTPTRPTPEVLVMRLKDTPHFNKALKVRCGAPSCGIVSIKTSEGAGCLSLSAAALLACFTQYSKRTIGCTEASITNWNVLGNGFDILLFQAKNQNFRNVKITVTLKMGKTNTKSEISEKKDEGKRFKGQLNKIYYRITAGSFEERYPYLNQFSLSCLTNCKNVQISIIKGEGNVSLFVSDAEHVLIHKNGIFNNVTCTLKYPGSGMNRCRNEANQDKFDLSTQFYIGLVPDPSFRDVEIIVKADNLIAFSKPDFNDETDIRKLAAVIGPIKKGQHAHFQIKCRRNTKCQKSKLEVFGNGQFSILAGSNTYTDQFGNCPGCKCNSISSCKIEFDPDGDIFYATMKALVDYNDLAYLKVSGPNVKSVKSYCFFKGGFIKSLSDLYRYPYVPYT